MSKIFSTYNQWHFGDNLVHLNFLRRLAVQHPEAGFVHYCDPSQHTQLREVIQDLPNVQLGLGQIPRDATDSWKNTGAAHQTARGWDQQGWWDKHPKKFDWAGFHVEWFRYLAERMGGLQSPIHTTYDLLFDFPALLQSRASNLNFDILVINSRPASGQLASYRDPFCFDPLLNRLKHRGYAVACTQATNVPDVFCTAAHSLTLTDIGNLALRVKHIVGVSTGPDWLTHSVHNVETCYRIVLLDKEKLNLPGHGVHVSSVDDAAQKLVELRVI